MSNLKAQVIYLFLLFPFLIFSQDLTLSGIVKDENNKPIAYANVVVLNETDSMTVSGSMTNDKGNFKISNINPKNYFVKVSFLGFKTHFETIALSEDIYLTITLSEENQNLEEVTLTVKKPTLKREMDRLIFNVESTSLTEGSIWDILKSTPGILMMNDEVLVKNSSNIIYLINEKRVYLSGDDLQQLLSGTAADAVQAVEVITNPSAKYDASGDAVINIKMSKNLVAGYNGSIYNNYTQGVYPRNSAGTSHFFKSKKTSFFAGYSYNISKLNRKNVEEVNFLDNNIVVGNWNTDIDRNTWSRNHNANMNFDYFINNKNTFSISGNASITPYWKRETKAFTQAVDSTFSSLNDTKDDKLNVGLNANYIYESEKGSRLSFNVHHTNYEYDRYQDVITDYKDTGNSLIRSNSFETTSDQNIKIYSAQTDLSIPVKDNGAFEIGFKASNIDSESDINQILTNNNSETIDLDNSGLFNYDEDNIAGYINLSKAWEKWDLSLGLRSEYTKAKGVLENELGSTNDFDYLKWFPTFNLTHKLGEKHSLGVGYNRRIERPTYSSLNPFKFYFNDNSFVEGNPNLMQTIFKLATLTYKINDTYTFEAYYRVVDDLMTELIIQDNQNNQIKYLATNLNQGIDFGLDFSTYTSLTKNWNIYLVTSVFKDRSEYLDENNNIADQTRWSFYGNWINYFSFLKDNSLTADLSLLYISPVILGPSEWSSRAQVDLGLKKSFGKGNWTLSVRASDIFLTSDYTLKNKYGGQDNQFYSRFDNRWVRLGLRYKFGNTRLQTNENIKELEERDRIKNEH